MTHQEYTTRVNEANRHSYLYYVLSRPEISDAAFDALLRSIEEYESTNPSKILPDSPTQTVGSDINGNGHRLITHRTPMLSQQKAHSIPDVLAWMNKYELNDVCMCLEWKMDGISCSLVYIDGQLVSAATRGDGIKGQDIMSHIRLMPSVPQTISLRGRVEVRGEVVCKKGQHIVLGYKDERTAASAICNTSYSESAKSLDFVVWEVIANGFDYFTHDIKLNDMGFNVVTKHSVCLTDKNLPSIIEDFTNKRELLEYPVDGIVIKVGNKELFYSYGSNKHHPHASIAYKFAAASATTIVRRIEIKIADSGKRTPVAHIEPVCLNGKNITKVNLYTEKTMLDLGVTEGCSVVVSLHNDVTPKIIKVVTDDCLEEDIYPSEENEETEKVGKNNSFITAIIIALIVLTAILVAVVGIGALLFFPLAFGVFK